MMKKTSTLSEAREEKRQTNGWTLEEIKKRAVEDFKKYMKISGDNGEPESFHSGDMSKYMK